MSGGDAAESFGHLSGLDKIRAFASKNFFLLGMAIAVTLARVFPTVRKISFQF